MRLGLLFLVLTLAIDRATRPASPYATRLIVVGQLILAAYGVACVLYVYGFARLYGHQKITRGSFRRGQTPRQ